MSELYGKKILKGIKERAQKAGAALQQSELSDLCIKAADYDGAPPKEENLIYTVSFSPESAEMADDMGIAVMECMETVDRNGVKANVLKISYHDVSLHIPLPDYEAGCLDAFKVKPDEREVLSRFKITSIYPIMDAGSEVVKTLTEAGMLTIAEAQLGWCKGKKSAQITLPDEAFKNLTEPQYRGYMGRSGAAMMSAAIENGGVCTEEALRTRVLGDEYDTLLKHLYKVCDHTVRCVKIVDDSHGMVLLPFKYLEKEELDFLDVIYKKQGMDLSKAAKKMAMRDIGGVLSYRLGRGVPEVERRENAKNLTDFLNRFWPMRNAREKALINGFSKNRLLKVVSDSGEATFNRMQKYRDEEAAKTACAEENGEIELENGG